MHKNYYIGVDGGGSKTHAILVDQNKEIIAEQFAGAANIRTDVEGAYNSICTAVDNLLKTNNLSNNEVAIGIGVAGYSASDKLQILEHKLIKNYPTISINSDCHIACLAAHNNQDGSIIICGTGVVGYTISNSQTNQISGWGFPHGDLGGGAWLGLEIARSLCLAIDEITSWNDTLRKVYNHFFAADKLKCKMWLINAKPSDYAEIAKFIFTQPLDKFASLLLQKGIEEVSQLLLLLNKKSPNLPVRLIGGLSRLYIDQLKKINSKLEISTKAPAMGAIYMVS